MQCTETYFLSFTTHLFFRINKSHRKGEIMAPFQTAVTLGDDSRDGQEVIEVQILPQVVYI